MAEISIPRIIIAGTSGGSGKTFVSLGLCYTLLRRGFNIQPYKKGPDYIDSAWLSLAANRPCICLDPFFSSENELNQIFINNFDPSDIAIIEGNRGLFDGHDVAGSCSTAHVASTLNAPVILALDCTKMTRTAAAIVFGLANFDENVKIEGVILNQIASARHGNIIQKSIEQYTDVPVLGILPRLRHNPIPERHMGLSLNQQSDPEKIDRILSTLADHMENNTDIDSIASIAHASDMLMSYEAPKIYNFTLDSKESSKKPRIAYIYDDAMWFYYKENLDALKKEGAELVPISLFDKNAWFTDNSFGDDKPNDDFNDTSFNNNSNGDDGKNNTLGDDSLRDNILRDDSLRDSLNDNNLNNSLNDNLNDNLKDSSSRKFPFDALYIGGGFPELFAKEIIAAGHLMEIRTASLAHMPIYAECGGFMLLSSRLIEGENKHRMASIFPTDVEFREKPQGLGYVEVQTLASNPFHPIGSVWRGHEFHYSRCIMPEKNPPDCILKLSAGTGMQKKDAQPYDGLVVHKTFASYTHLYAPAVPHWAENFVAAATDFMHTSHTEE